MLTAIYILEIGIKCQVCHDVTYLSRKIKVFMKVLVKNISDDMNLKLTVLCRTKQPSPEHTVRREGLRHDTSSNGRRFSGPSNPQPESFSALSPKSPDYEESDDEDNSNPVDHRYKTSVSSYFYGSMILL